MNRIILALTIICFSTNKMNSQKFDVSIGSSITYYGDIKFVNSNLFNNLKESPYLSVGYQLENSWRLSLHRFEHSFKLFPLQTEDVVLGLITTRDIRTYSLNLGYSFSKGNFKLYSNIGFGISEYRDSELILISNSELNFRFKWERNVFSFLTGLEGRYYPIKNIYFGITSDIIFSSKINHTPLVLTAAIGYEF